MRVGLLGGSFNPPHAAHRLISVTALKRLRLHRVWWLVTPGNPLKDHAGLPPLQERLRLCRKAANHPYIEVTALEAALGTSYTAETLVYLRRQFPTVRFVWLMGADNLVTFHRWKGWEIIAATMPFAVADRPNYRHPAIASPAARRFAYARKAEWTAALLPAAQPPAWVYLSGPVSGLSSTAIRAAAS
jgi:nicotinate-nucleotide adenylyltransferase